MRRVVPLVLLLSACKKGDDLTPEPEPLLDVAESASWTIPGLSAESYVVYTELGVPHVYAKDQGDLGRVLGFTVARDRFFYMDLARRLSQAEISALLGDAGLETDLESRQTGMTYVTDRILTLLEGDPEMAAYFDGFAEGVNAYVDAVKAGELPAPSEFELAAGLLGKSGAADLLEPFDRRDVAAGFVTVLYESGFETGDIGRARDAAGLDGVFGGAPEEELRKQGFLQDIWGNTAPPRPIASAPGWLASHPPVSAPSLRRGHGAKVEAGALRRWHGHAQRIEDRLGHEWVSGFGSNAWAVDAAHSADGRAMLAADGHLQLSIPPILYSVGLDTAHLGGEGGLHQVGTMIPALPLLATGTNGDVAFGQTQLMGDITDWYAEELKLDDAGLPVSSRFQGADKPLIAVPETIDVAVIPPPLGSGSGGPFTFTRYTTFDGRWITSIEGDDVGDYDDATPPVGAVLVGSDWIDPRDVDGSGTITAVSFDYTGLDLTNMPRVMDAYTKAGNVDTFADATRDLSSHSLNLVAADADGNIFYTGFEAIPCRTYLDRNPDGTWVEGADPSLLLDGTRYGGFTIPVVDGRIDTTQQSDPTRCVVPWDEYPHEKNPAQGYLVSANIDPGGASLDGTLTNDAWYTGGPWIEGYRATRIADDLAAAIADGGVSVDDMKAVQGDHTSTIGLQLAPVLIAALERASDEGDASGPDTSRGRMNALYQSNKVRFDEAYDRLVAWRDAGLVAESGVETFYNPAPPQGQKDAAVATSIFNAWMGRFVGHVVGDEGMPGLGWPTGDTGRFRVVTMAIDGRGPGNPLDLAAWNPDTEEPIWCDILSTGPLETCDESALIALADALDFLASPVTAPGAGGFGTEDMSQWLWGLKHLAKMTSLLGDFLGGGGPIGALTAPFNITPDTLPLTDGTLASGDPRKGLPGFPRPGDHLSIDALNSGTDGVSFDAGDGSVNRTVVALGGSGFEAYNIIPGGQSGLTDSEHFADQARLWLGNAYSPMWLHVEDVVAHGARRETFRAP